MLHYVIIACLMTFNAEAQQIIGSVALPQSDTFVFGEAATADGTENEALVAQPENAPNPLGNPVADYTPSTVPAVTAKETRPIKGQMQKPATNEISETDPQNPSDSQMTPQQMNDEIQNKLYEEGNRIYDVQSYPLDDIDYLNQNGQDNAITDYPSY